MSHAGRTVQGSRLYHTLNISPGWNSKSVSIPFKLLCFSHIITNKLHLHSFCCCFRWSSTWSCEHYKLLNFSFLNSCSHSSPSPVRTMCASAMKWCRRGYSVTPLKATAVVGTVYTHTHRAYTPSTQTRGTKCKKAEKNVLVQCLLNLKQVTSWLGFSVSSVLL